MLRYLCVRGALSTGALWMVVFSWPLSASAQPPSYGRNPISRPTVSPYLNLLNNGGANPGLNYYNLVRPEQQFQQAANQFSRELNSVRSTLNGLQKPQTTAAQATPQAPGRMTTTGHGVSFGNSGGYFPGSAGGFRR